MYLDFEKEQAQESLIFIIHYLAKWAKAFSKEAMVYLSYSIENITVVTYCPFDSTSQWHN